MATEAIRKGDPGYEKLFNLWLAQGQKVWVTLPNGEQFQALRPSDDEVIFRPHSADSLYSSLSGQPGG